MNQLGGLGKLASGMGEGGRATKFKCLMMTSPFVFFSVISVMGRYRTCVGDLEGLKEDLLEVVSFVVEHLLQSLVQRLQQEQKHKQTVHKDLTNDM
jgi:hypothetical protein